MKPSIETAKKLADARSVSLNYLVSNGDLIKRLDKKALQRLDDINKTAAGWNNISFREDTNRGIWDDKTPIFYAIDKFIKAAKLKAI